MGGGTEARVNWACGAPDAIAPAKRSLKVNDGCKDRVRGAGDMNETQSSNEESFWPRCYYLGSFIFVCITFQITLLIDPKRSSTRLLPF
jgi:hypothetical protein